MTTMTTVLLRPKIRRDTVPELGTSLYFTAEDLESPATYEAAARAQLAPVMAGAVGDIEDVIAKVLERYVASVAAEGPANSDMLAAFTRGQDAARTGRAYTLAGEKTAADRVAFGAGYSSALEGLHADADAEYAFGVNHGRMDWLPSPAMVREPPSLVVDEVRYSPRARSQPAPRRVRATLSESKAEGWASDLVADGWAVPDSRRPTLWRIERVLLHWSGSLERVAHANLTSVELEAVEEALLADVHAQMDEIMSASTPAHVRLYCLRTGLEVEDADPGL